MEYIDLTLLVDENYLEYPGDIPFEMTDELTYPKDKTNIKRLHTNMHIGTHIDAPLHAINHGKSIDSLNINKLIGKAIVCDASIENNVIKSKSIIQQYDFETKILVIRTNHSKFVNTPKYYQYPTFERDFIDFIKNQKIEVLALDFPSPTYFNEGHMELHIDLLNENVIVVENLVHLDQLNKYVEFIALPLKIKGLDGSLTRCVARNI